MSQHELELLQSAVENNTNGFIELVSALQVKFDVWNSRTECEIANWLCKFEAGEESFVDALLYAISFVFDAVVEAHEYKVKAHRAEPFNEDSLLYTTVCGLSFDYYPDSQDLYISKA